MNIVLLAPLYLPPPEYFSVMAEADMAIIDTSMRYDKRRKDVHRTVVSGKDGFSSFLTVPVSTPGTSRCAWNNVGVSAHGEWWRVQKMTMSTLYGRTPYFDLFRHDLFPYFSAESIGSSITDLNIKLIIAIRRLTGIKTPLSVTLDPRYEDDKDIIINDMRIFNFYAADDVRSVIEVLFQNGKI